MNTQVSPPLDLVYPLRVRLTSGRSPPRRYTDAKRPYNGVELTRAAADGLALTSQDNYTDDLSADLTRGDSRVGCSDWLGGGQMNDRSQCLEPKRISPILKHLSHC